MSAHYPHRRFSRVFPDTTQLAAPFSPHSTPQDKTAMPQLTRPHITDMNHPTSGFEITMLLFAILLMAGLVIFLIYSCLYSFEWFRNMMDPHDRFRYNAERVERAGLWASREGGAFARAAEDGDRRRLLCDRSGYLGGGRGYGWRTRAYGDGAAGDGNSTYGSVSSAEDRRASDASGRSFQHRDDCNGFCGLTERKSSRVQDRPDKVGDV